MVALRQRRPAESVITPRYGKRSLEQEIVNPTNKSLLRTPVKNLQLSMFLFSLGNLLSEDVGMLCHCGAKYLYVIPAMCGSVAQRYKDYVIM